MKQLYAFLIIIISFMFIGLVEMSSNPVIIQNDNGTPRTSYPNRQDWEESVFLVPDGPCNITEIQIYYYGTSPGTDTIFVVGDPAEGAIPPTMWVLSYNAIIDPIAVNYDGNQGWKNFKVSGLRSDGFDRICIQHRLRYDGPWFAIDNNGTSSPLGHFC